MSKSQSAIAVESFVRSGTDDGVAVESARISGGYVLVAIIRKELRVELSLSQILQILSVNVFEQVPLAELVAKTASQNDTTDSRNQWMLGH